MLLLIVNQRPRFLPDGPTMIDQADVTHILRTATLFPDQISVSRRAMLELASQCAGHPQSAHMRNECQDESRTFLLVPSATARELCEHWLGISG